MNQLVVGSAQAQSTGVFFAGQYPIGLNQIGVGADDTAQQVMGPMGVSGIALPPHRQLRIPLRVVLSHELLEHILRDHAIALGALQGVALRALEFSPARIQLLDCQGWIRCQ